VLCYVVWLAGIALMFLTVFPRIYELLGGYGNWKMLAMAFTGITLQELGYGAVQPLQPVLVADQFHKEQSRSLESSFSVFYFFASVGSLLGESTGPILRQSTSWEITVGVNLALMGIGALMFISGGFFVRRLPVQIDTRRSSLWRSLLHDLADIRHLMWLFVPLPIFWGLFFQQNSTWVFQAQQMDLEIGPIGRLPRFSVPPDLMPSLEDVFCLLLIVVMDKLLYPLARRLGWPFTPLRKIGLGFIAITLSFAMAGIVDLWIRREGDGVLSVAWQVPQIFLMGIAEVTVAIPILDFVYTQSTPEARNTAQAVIQVTAALGNGIVALLAMIKFDPSDHYIYFFMFCGMMLLVFAAFVFLARRYRYREMVEATDKI
jgi:dipeptide/tripeptide permease